MPSSRGTGSLYDRVAGVLAGVAVDAGGGCSVLKAYLMADLIRRHRMRATLDIGVYRGRSLFPQALAHNLYTGGEAYGVDPWAAAEAVQRDTPALAGVLKTWLDETDFEALYQGVAARRDALGLGANCRLVRRSSADAADLFRSEGRAFDLVHIDGNHDTEPVLRDVRAYSNLLRPGGFVVMDDVSWASVRPALDLLAGRMTKVYERVSGPDDFAIYWNARSPLRAAGMNLRFRAAAVRYGWRRWARS